jgi:leader peptidase (prepilin peptidase) / N-methyltransferase
VHLSDTGVSVLDSILGAFAGAGFFFIASGLYLLLRKRPGMGSGDFALMAMSGAFLGLKLTLLVIFLATLTAAAYALVLIVRQIWNTNNTASVKDMLQTGEIPFGVFISAASLAVAFFGEAVWRWYVGFF